MKDTQAAAAAEGGEEKTWAKMKKKETIRMNTSEENVLMAPAVFIEFGKHTHKLGAYRRAMEFFDTALELEPDNLGLLEPRAQTLIKLAFFTEALEEIEKLEAACEAVPLATRRLQAEALWQCGEFEKSAILAAKGMRVRTKPTYFTDMYYTNQMSLEQCVGEPSEVCMSELSSNTELLERLRPNPSSGSLAPIRKERPPTNKEKEELCREARYKAFLWDRHLFKARVFLGGLDRDVEYIGSLAAHPSLPSSANKSSESRMRRHIDTLNGDLTRRMLYMEQECPLYAMRHRRAEAAERRSSAMRDRGGEEQEARTSTAREEVTRAILRVLAANGGDPRVLTHALDAARLLLEKTTAKVLPEKSVFQELLYHLIGLTYLTLGQFHITAPDPDGKERQKREQVYSTLQTGEKSDVMMHGSSMPFHDYGRSLQTAQARLRRARSKLERLCCSFEMAHCCSKLHRWDEALSHSRKALASARDLGHNAWGVLAAVERAKAELHLNNRIEAKTTIKEAIELADQLDDEYCLEGLYAIAEELEHPSRQVGVEAGGDSPQSRIMSLMVDARTRNQCAELFCRMNALPPEYRLPLEARWSSGGGGGGGDGGRERPGSSGGPAPATRPRTKSPAFFGDDGDL